MVPPLEIGVTLTDVLEVSTETVTPLEVLALAEAMKVVPLYVLKFVQYAYKH